MSKAESRWGDGGSFFSFATQVRSDPSLEVVMRRRRGTTTTTDDDDDA